MRSGPRIALSVLTIVTATACAVVGVTFAPFTSAATGNGSVSAGTVNVVLNDNTDDEVALEYTGVECGNLAHGESCSASFTVRNAGSLSVRYRIEILDEDAACYTTVLDTEAQLEAGLAEAGDAHADWDGGSEVSGIITTTLDGDDASCQGSTNEVLIVVRARQSASPHD